MPSFGALAAGAPAAAALPAMHSAATAMLSCVNFMSWLLEYRYCTLATAALGGTEQASSSVCQAGWSIGAASPADCVAIGIAARAAWLNVASPQQKGGRASAARGNNRVLAAQATNYASGRF